MSFIIKEVAPTCVEFAALRKLVGWDNPEDIVLQASIDASLFWITIYSGAQLVATGRVIGDGAMYFYIQDVIVHPSYQQRGLGQQIMSAIERYLDATCQQAATVGLLSAQGKEEFYRRFGFIERDGKTLGLGMCKFL
ncbi:GNAT family N-acetyltransferase [Alteromonas facilis]|uniref:GNAT family N-acetyltransferase n=1 Tax=Alteromonas facilis TaxID=2048004 RepID=UPI0013DAE2E6|nr:GNAT family N-acetyltransferase [Alteromonas facilis]